MKRFYRMNLASLMLASASAFSTIPVEGWYAGGMGAISYLPQVDATIINPVTGTALTTAELTYSLGGGGGGQIGYRWCYFRFEGQLFLDTNPYDKLSAGGVAIKTHYIPLLTTPAGAFSLRMNGYTDVAAAFFNGYWELYDEDNDPSIIPYLGLGIGYAYIQNKITINTFVPPLAPGLPSFTFTASDSEDNDTPIAQLILGASYFFTESLSLSTDYRYLTTKTIQVGPITNRLKLHTVNFSLNYSFDL